MARRARRAPSAPRCGERVDERLDDLRQRIDALDERLVELLNERASLRAARSARSSSELGHGHLSAGARDAGAAARAEHAWHRAGRSAADALTRLFERIIDEARRLERDRVGASAGDGERRPRRSVDARRGLRARKVEVSSMVVVMQERATRGPDREGRRAPGGAGHGRAPIDRREPHGAGRGRRRSPARPAAHRDARRRQRSAARHRAVQARQPRVQARGHRRHASATCGLAATKSS